jgi:hypothetical protein
MQQASAIPEKYPTKSHSLRKLAYAEGFLRLGEPV